MNKKSFIRLLKDQIRNKRIEVLIKIDILFKSPFLFDYQKLLLKLSFVLVIAILIVIRGSTARLLFNMKFLHFLFVSDANGDKTFYNIGISYIAAYIFFIIQVYIPEKRRARSQISAIYSDHNYLIFLLNQYILSVRQFVVIEDGKVYFKCNSFSYKTNDGQIYDVDNDIFTETYTMIHEVYGRIAERENLEKCDYEYIRSFLGEGKIVVERLRYLKSKLAFLSQNDGNLSDREHIEEILLAIERFTNRMKRVTKCNEYDNCVIIPYKGNSKIKEEIKRIF